MDRFFHHLLRVLVVVLGLVFVQPSFAQTFDFSDQGQAFAACVRDLGTAIRLQEPSNRPDDPYVSAANRNIQLACGTTINSSGLRPPAPNQDRYMCGVEWWFQTDTRAPGTGARANRSCANPSFAGSTQTSATYRFPTAATCATRPRMLTTVPGDVTAMCHNGCRYTSVGVSVVFIDPPLTGGTWMPTGQTCVPTPEQPSPPNPPPPDADSDSDGVPDSQDERPLDPACSIGCGPGPGEQPPQPPEDSQDDGAQVAAALGPKLDEIEQAVLGLGPRIDGVRAAVDGARADANADADGIRSALDGIRSAIVAQGPNGGGDGTPPGDGDGPIDMSPLNPGPDGGQHPTLDDIVEEGDASQLLAQLDTDGWGFSRSCPANSWTQSFDLGFGTLDMSQVSGFACLAGSIIGWMLALAGMIQAAYILGRMGMS